MIKNRIGEKAAEGIPAGDLLKDLKGMCSVAYTSGDPVALASLPPKEEIYAKLLYLIQAPAQRLVSAMGGVGRNLAVVVDQGVKENKFSS